MDTTDAWLTKRFRRLSTYTGYTRVAAEGWDENTTKKFSCRWRRSGGAHKEERFDDHRRSTLAHLDVKVFIDGCHGHSWSLYKTRCLPSAGKCNPPRFTNRFMFGDSSTVVQAVVCLFVGSCPHRPQHIKGEGVSLTALRAVHLISEEGSSSVSI